MSREILACVLAICLFFLLNPYFLWKFSYLNRVSITALFVVVGIAYFDWKVFRKYIGFSLLFLFVGLNRSSGFINILLLVSTTVLFALPYGLASSVFKKFSIFYVVTALISLFFFILFSFLDVDTMFYLTPLNVLKEYNFKNYFVFIKPEIFNAVEELRFHFIFEEPGEVATILMFILAGENFRIKSALSIGSLFLGAFTFSFFFYGFMLIVICHNLLSMWNVNYKVILLMLVVFFLFSNFSALDDLIFKRFTFNDETGLLSGFNRGELLVLNEMAGNWFSNSGLFGYGYAAYEQFMDGGSIFHVIYREGLFVVTCYLIILFLLIYKFINKHRLIWILFLATLLYHRPMIFDVFFIFFIGLVLNRSSVSIINRNPIIDE